MSPPNKKNVSRNQIDVDRSYLKRANELRASTDDPKAQSVSSSAVGCIIVADGEVLAGSANVVPPLARGEILAASGGQVANEDRYFFLEHAERAAIFKAQESRKKLSGATLYCTRFPCSDCARAIVWAGIKRIVLAESLPEPQLSHTNTVDWHRSQAAALRLFEAASIEVVIEE